MRVAARSARELFDVKGRVVTRRDARASPRVVDAARCRHNKKFPARPRTTCGGPLATCSVMALGVVLIVTQRAISREKLFR